ncbi:MAG: 5-formyltetrahydrofolate cyclo-ligase [Bacillota bacterium]
MTKKEQRKILKKKVNLFKRKVQASLEIAKKLFELQGYKAAKSIFIYLSMDYEVDTELIIKDAFRSGKKVYVPVIKKDNKMYAARLYPFSLMKKGKYKIKEPIITILAKTQPDIAIIPLAGFDKEKNRLGRGGGYFDRFLEGFKGEKVALAFSCQRLEKVVTDENDKKMDKIITEDELF